MSRLLLLAVFSCLGVWSVQSQSTGVGIAPDVSRPVFTRPPAAAQGGGVLSGNATAGGGVLNPSAAAGGGVLGGNVTDGGGVLGTPPAALSAIAVESGAAVTGGVLGSAALSENSTANLVDRSTALSERNVTSSTSRADLVRDASAASELSGQGPVVIAQPVEVTVTTEAGRIATIIDPLERERARFEAQRLFRENLLNAIFTSGSTRIPLPQSNNSITLFSTNGTVTIQGTVTDNQTRVDIENEIRSLAELAGISNQLLVNSRANSQSDAVGGIINEGSGSGLLTQSLSEAVSLGGTRSVVSGVQDGVITVISGNGIVALFGDVATTAQRSQIAEQVSQIAGVREVQNNLVVREQ